MIVVSTLDNWDQEIVMRPGAPICERKGVSSPCRRRVYGLKTNPEHRRTTEVHPQKEGRAYPCSRRSVYDVGWMSKGFEELVVQKMGTRKT